jgi:soluble epoxide hydrolase / lipid-phosphate phosphatase
MASIAFPSLAKSVKLPSGTTYSYVWSPPSDSNPTILFLHGFPSSSYDWRHQISFFKAKKYGVLVPDLLGYGGTDKPASPEPYRLKTIATDIVAILDHEKLEKVHAVGHDFGSIQLARIINYFPDRLLSCAFLVVPYSPPGQRFDLDLLKVLTEQVMGFEKFGYMRFMDREDSGDVIDAHVCGFASFSWCFYIM